MNGGALDFSAVKPFIEEEQIQNRIDELASEVAKDSQTEEIVAIGLLKGSFIFMADLIRKLHGQKQQVRLDFMKVSSYGANTESSGEVRLLKDIDFPVENRNILVVDDILDSGHSLSMVLRHLSGHAPKSLKTCVLLDKPERRSVPVEADYVGFAIPNHFVG